VITTRAVRNRRTVWGGRKASPIPIENRIMKKLSPGMFQSHDRIFIVGGGPSLKDFDFSQLRDEITIGINKAFAFFDPTIIFSMDRRFWLWVEKASGADGFTPELRDRFIDYRHGFKCWLDPHNQLFTPDITRIRCHPDLLWGETLEEGIGHGLNSGYAALNLAYVLGFKEIYLLGFDMKGSGGRQAWFHEGYAKPYVTSDSVYSKMIYQFEKYAAPRLAEMGIKVWNCSPDSNLMCFPYKDIGSVDFVKNPIVVSAHSSDAIYKAHSENLDASLKSRGYRRIIREFPSLGNWNMNAQYKAKFLLDILNGYADGESFIWLDADAEVVGDLMSIKDDWSDIACHMKDGTELLSGTIYLKNNAATRNLISDWVEACAMSPNTWDQKLLHKLITLTPGLKFRNLEARFCKIFDSMAHVENGIVVHNQASRIARDLIK